MAETNAAYTVSYSEDVKGWPSFYSYLPDYMIGMNGYFYSWNKGNLYRHNTNTLRNNYYDQQFSSEITSVFNVEPKNIKLFKTMSYESNAAWQCTSLFTDLNTGSMPGDGTPPPPYPSTIQTWFVQKEGEWFSFLRENSDTVNFKDRSANGIGTSVTVSGPLTAVVITFNVNIGSILSVGDIVYWQSTAAPIPPATFNPIVKSGTVTAVVNQSTTSVAGVVTPASITIDCTAFTPNGTPPAIGDFIFFIKDAIAESHGARGYYMHFTLTNYDTTPVELFSVGSSVMKSFP
jgi:hypothetical protein